MTPVAEQGASSKILSNFSPSHHSSIFIMSATFIFATYPILSKVLYKLFARILSFSIAKSFEDQKKYDQASEFLKVANSEIDSTIDKKIMIKWDGLKIK